jgi:hypothetical protein
MDWTNLFPEKKGNPILAALQAKENIYAGTVPAATVAKRRARNKRARAARRINR